MIQIVLIHGGKSTVEKLREALPGADVALVYREGLSAVYDEKTGIAHDYPKLEDLMYEYAPDWRPGDPLVILAFSAGAWALRYYLRDPDARDDITAAIFLDGLYGAPGGRCNLDPYEGVVEFGQWANDRPDEKRLIMTYSHSHPGPEICSKAIAAAAGGEEGGVFVRGFDTDHGSQQGIVGPKMVRELIAPWIKDRGGRFRAGVIGVVLALGAVAAAIGWKVGTR